MSRDRRAWLPMAAFLAALAVALFVPFFWCRYLCPLNAVNCWKLCLVKRANALFRLAPRPFRPAPGELAHTGWKSW